MHLHPQLCPEGKRPVSNKAPSSLNFPNLPPNLAQQNIPGSSFLQVIQSLNNAVSALGGTQLC